MGIGAHGRVDQQDAGGTSPTGGRVTDRLDELPLHLEMPMLICLGLASSRLGRLTSSTPFLNSALIFS